MMYWTGVATWTIIAIFLVVMIAAYAREFCRAWILCYRHVTERFKNPYAFYHSTKTAWNSLWESGIVTSYSWQKPMDQEERYGLRDVIRMYREMKANK